MFEAFFDVNVFYEIDSLYVFSLLFIIRLGLIPFMFSSRSSALVCWEVPAPKSLAFSPATVASTKAPSSFMAIKGCRVGVELLAPI